MGQPVAVDAEVKRWRDEAVGLRRRVKVLERANGELVAANRELRGRVAELGGQVERLSERVEVLARLAFGGGSEKRIPASEGAAGADGGGRSAGQEQGSVGRQRRRRGQQPGMRGHGRRDYSGLPAVEVVDEVAETDRVCAVCGAGYVRSGTQTSELIDWQVWLQRVVHRRPRWRRVCQCQVPAVLAAPPPPRPIPKGRFTAGFVARLLCDKYALGLPLHRIVVGLSHDGVGVAEGTLVGVLQQVSGLLGPLEQQLWARNATAAHLHVDETSWKVFQAVAGKASHRWWCWVFVGPDTTVFRIQPSRSTAVLAEHLGVDLDADSLEPGRRLLVSSDFFGVYQRLGQVQGVQALWCWAHLRRYFVHAGQVHPELAGWSDQWVARIGALYGAHRQLATTQPGSPAHARAIAAMHTAVAAIDSARRAQSADPHLPGPAVKVLAILQRQWDGLVRHLDHPELPLDNNSAERALRGPVVGRKNYYGAGSVTSARLAAQTWTICATAQRAGASPLAYLTAYLQACAANGGRPPTGQALQRFLPWQATPADLQAWRAPTGGPAP
jgi:transposase